MIVRSFAVATFLVGQGLKPLGVELQGAGYVFVFDDAAHLAVTKYNTAKATLEELVARKTAVPGGLR